MDKLEFKTSVHNERRVAPTKPQEHKHGVEDNIAMRKLARNAVICIALLVCLMAVKTLDDGEDDALSVDSSELIQDEDLGKLQFVSENSFSNPLEDGEVVFVFSNDNMSVKVAAKSEDRVHSVLDGRVTEIGQDSVKMENVNGTVTEYSGLRPCIHAGEEVLSSQVIGYLIDEELTLTTVGGTGYIDTLDMQEMAYAAIDCEE